MQGPRLLLHLGALAGTLLLSGCFGNGPILATPTSPTTPTTPTTPTVPATPGGNFTTTWFLGDSITAGFQSGSLIDTSQPNGWAPLVAKQVNFSITLPLIASPGAPNQLTLVHLGPPPVLGQLSGVSAGRDNPTVQPTDVAVPGAVLNDVLNAQPTANPTTGQGTLNTLILGYPGIAAGRFLGQAQLAANAKPTTIFLWIGNNDALAGATSGSPLLLTPLSSFTTQYQTLITYLTNNTTAHLVIANIPDVTALPSLQPAAAILAQYSAATSIPVATLSLTFGIVPGDLVTQQGLTEITAILAGTQKSTLSDAGVLTAAEATTVRTMVNSYNSVIASNATASGATLVDINALFASITASGITLNGVPGNASFLGGFFSLDGVHPTNTGYAIIADKFIDTMNTAFKTTVADVNVAAIAAVDPLFPPYPGHKGLRPPVTGYVMPPLPPNAAEHLKELLGAQK